MGTQRPSPKSGHRPQIFGPCLLWPNDRMDQDATCYDGRPRSGQHCVRCEPNDIAENISATVRLFADDTIAYLAVATDRDAQTSQDDLTKLGVWEQRWHMEFT